MIDSVNVSTLRWLTAECSKPSKNAVCLNVPVQKVLSPIMEIHVTIPLTTPRIWRMKKTRLLPGFVLIRANSWLKKVLPWLNADG
jgi:hypothetical protein